MTAPGGAAVTPGVLVASHGWPETRASAGQIIAGLLDALDVMRGYADHMWRAGLAEGRAQAAGYCAAHGPDLADARAEGAALATADLAGGASAFAAGWNACLDRFADEIGGRAAPAHPGTVEAARWTRHAPRCRHAGGSQSCQRAGCIQRTRATFAGPAPWDQPHDQAAMIAAARASWGLPS